MKWLGVLLALTSMLLGDLAISSGSTSFVVKNESGGYDSTRLFTKRRGSDTEKGVTFQSLGDSDSDDDSDDESDIQCENQDNDNEEKGKLPIIE